MEAERPDVVLLDVHLGGEESTRLLEHLRAEGIPVALVTGSADMRDTGCGGRRAPEAVRAARARRGRAAAR